MKVTTRRTFFRRLFKIPVMFCKIITLTADGNYFIIKTLLKVSDECNEEILKKCVLNIVLITK